MTNISFFTPVVGASAFQSKMVHALEIVDSYFYLGGRRAKIISLEENQITTKFIDTQTSLFTTAIKIASYCTIILPALFLIAKIALRWQFTIVATSKKNNSKTISVPSTFKTSHQIFKVEKQQFRLQLTGNNLTELVIKDCEGVQKFLLRMIKETSKTNGQVTVICMQGSPQTVVSILKESLFSKLLEFNPSRYSNLLGVSRSRVNWLSDIFYNLD